MYRLDINNYAQEKSMTEVFCSIKVLRERLMKAAIQCATVAELSEEEIAEIKRNVEFCTDISDDAYSGSMKIEPTEGNVLFIGAWCEF